VLAGVGCGALACAILVANNLRDIETDRVAGKRTLAVRLGSARTRWFYVLLLGAAFAAGAVAGVRHPAALIVLVSALPAAGCSRTVLGGATGRELVPVLKTTGVILLGYGLLLGVGLWVS
jgi:1,4-dihydroxy-2-naphthoate octaprenyltransferase